MKITRKYFARKKVVSKIKSDLGMISNNFGALMEGAGKVEIAETDEGATYVLIDGEAAVFSVGGEYFPTVRGALRIDVDRRFVTVDRGAVPFVTNGADVMRPGIVGFDEGIKEGDLVVINEETHKKPIGIGRALLGADGLKAQKSGKSVKGILYVGDRIWNLE
jgi:PUA domain protein